jgi:hypothetical protein
MPAMRVCSCTSCPAHPGSCPELVTRGRCGRCGTQYERRRGTRQARGYDAAHDKLRRSWKPRVETGMVRCARCDRYITLGQAWDLGHTDDRTTWTGPEHASCNRSAGGKAAHR